MSSFETAASLAERLLATWCVLAISSTALLSVAWLCTSRLAKASAATRFAIWMGAAAGVLLVAAVRTVLPSRPIAVAWWPGGQIGAASTPTSARDGSARTVTMTTRPRPSTIAIDGVTTERETSGTTPPSITPPSITPPSITPPSITPPSVTLLTWMAPFPLSNWIALIALLVWFAGAIHLATRFLRGWWQVRAMVRRSSRVLDGSHWVQLQHVAEHMGVERAVALRWMDDEHVPVTTGIVCPVVLLPRAAMHWPDARVRIVLQHELAHIARADVALMALVQAALVLCWWQPLFWHAAQRMACERERACDDLVLTSGVPAIDYADELLHMVRALRTPIPSPFAALGMAQRTDSPSLVEARLRALLDPSVERRRTPQAVWTLVGIAALVVAPLGCLTPRARAQRTTADVTNRQAPAVSLDSATPRRSGAISQSMPPDSDLTRDMADPSDEFQFGEPCTTRAGSLSISRSVDDSIQRYQRVDPTGCLRMHLVGRPEFDANDVPVRLRGDNVRFVIEEVHGDRRRRVSLRQESGQLRPTYVENGRTVPTSDRAAMTTAAGWARDLYLQVARDVGLGVESRVPRLLQLGGVDALARELRAIRADDVAERYLITALSVPTSTAAYDEIEALAIAYTARVEGAALRRIQAAIATARERVESRR